MLRSCGIGTFIGVLPAEGATIASMIGYSEARRWSKNKEEFGKGAIEGIAGAESANNAATGGAMVPTMVLGIPGSGTNHAQETERVGDYSKQFRVRDHTRQSSLRTVDRLAA